MVFLRKENPAAVGSTEPILRVPKPPRQAVRSVQQLWQQGQSADVVQVNRTAKWFLNALTALVQALNSTPASTDEAHN
jgi:hypothetical protein